MLIRMVTVDPSAARCIPGAVLHNQYLEPPNAEFGRETG